MDKMFDDLIKEYNKSNDVEKDHFAEVVAQALNYNGSVAAPAIKKEKKPKQKENKRYGLLSDFDIHLLCNKEDSTALIFPFNEDNLESYSYKLTLSPHYMRAATFQELANNGSYQGVAVNPHLFENQKGNHLLENIEYIDPLNDQSYYKITNYTALPHPTETSRMIIVIPSKGTMTLTSNEALFTPEGVVAKITLNDTYGYLGIQGKEKFVNPDTAIGQIGMTLFNASSWPIVLNVDEPIFDVTFTRPFSMTRESYAKKRTAK